MYTGKYEISGNAGVLIREELMSKTKLPASAEGFTISTTSATVAEMVGSAVLVTTQAIGAEMIARLGWRKLQSGETVLPEQLDANYGRSSDAEIFAKSNS